MELDVVEITKGRVFKVLWCLLWRAYLGLVVVMLVVWGFGVAWRYCVFKLIGESSFANLSSEGIINAPVGLFGIALCLYIGFLVVRFIFKKKFSDFEVVLVAR
ncbi:MAG: hypothetical protein ACYSTX_02345, partial [Planctomycetota bacterium]